MNWNPRTAWAALAVLTVLAAWLLTRAVTHVHRNATATLGITFEERPPLALNVTHVDLSELKSARYHVPAIILADPRRVLFTLGPTTEAITFANAGSSQVSCRFISNAFTSTSLVVIVDRATGAPSIPATLSDRPQGGSRVEIPASLHDALQRRANSQGLMDCTLVRPLAASPTFTERTVTITATNGEGGVFLDAESLDNVDNVRFAGGLAVPIAGERIRLLTPLENVVSISWTDIEAQERHDIALVFVGGLAAIAAAMAIEAIRPFIEH